MELGLMSVLIDVPLAIGVAATAVYAAYDILKCRQAMRASPEEDGKGGAQVIMDNHVLAQRVRWNPRDQSLYVSDAWRGAVWRIRLDNDNRILGHPIQVLQTSARDGSEVASVDWMPDGSLIVAQSGYQLFHATPGNTVEDTKLDKIADLSLLGQAYLTDIISNGAGGFYAVSIDGKILYVPPPMVGNAPESVATPLAQEMWAANPVNETAPAVTTQLQETNNLTTAPWVAASGMTVPLALALTPDGRTLLFTQLFTCTLMAWDRDLVTNKLSNMHVWAELPGAYCSGLCLDAELCAWVGIVGSRNDPYDLAWQCLAGGPFAQRYKTWSTGRPASGFVRVQKGGQILQRIMLRDMVGLGCSLGGPDGHTLYISCCRTAEQEHRPHVGPGNALVAAVRVKVGAISLPPLSRL